jgi:hypothetical protein
MFNRVACMYVPISSASIGWAELPSLVYSSCGIGAKRNRWRGFIQQLAVPYVARGQAYGPLRDRVLPGARARRKRSGLANVRYHRVGDFFALLATHGNLNILRAVSRHSKKAGHPAVPTECIWLKRRPVLVGAVLFPGIPIMPFP